MSGIVILLVMALVFLVMAILPACCPSAAG